MMTSPDNSQDRRQRRSNKPLEAMGYQLDQVLRDFDLECCLIVDEDGTTIASASHSTSPLLDDLANLLPAMTMMPEKQWKYLDQLRRHRPKLDEEELTACVFRAGGRRFFIGAIGPEAVMNEVAIFRAITGARRIHSDG